MSQNNTVKWWHPDHFGRTLENLKLRARIIRQIRNYFDDLNYLEVETPALQHSAVMDPHIKAFKTTYTTPDYSKTRDYYLHTSPEFAMKKMLVGGADKIYQICKCFRNAEQSPNHSPEFTMLEWYHTGIDYNELMAETIGLIRAAHNAPYQFRGMTSDASQDWEVITVCEAFQKYAGVDLESCLEDVDALKDLAPHHYHEGDNFEDLFFRIFLEDIEPKLGHPAPTIIYDYPISMASLSRPKASDPRFCERFEVYICGLELANAFGELCDPKIQLKRFEKNMALKKDLYGDDYPIDYELITALEHGMQDVSGIALGVDRLVMLAANTESISDILVMPE